MFNRLLIVAIAATAVSATASAQELTGTLKKIKDSGTITVGYRESSVPFSYLDDKQQPIGFAMDICTKIVAAVKAELKLEKLDVKLNPVTSATRIPLLSNGTIDLECGSTTNNLERQKQVSYTNTHFLTATRLVSKKASAIKSIDDLKGKTIVSTAGTTNIKQMNEINTAKNLGMTILSGKDHAESFLMVETDRAVAFAMDDILLASLAAASKEPAAFEISKDAFSPAEPYGIMIPKDDPAFKKVVDGATAALYKAEGAALFKKWFQSPIAPKGLNLNFTMTPQLEKMLTTPSDSADPTVY
jgi:glutamate/aspartate transport system substrate-binding protein